MKNLFLLVLIVILSSCSVVGPGERGVRVSLGTVSSESKEPGAYLWIPFLLGMTKINVQIQKAEIESGAASKDMQEIKAGVAINWSLSPDRVVNTFKTIGEEEDVVNRILTPAVNEILKASTAKLTAEEVLTKRMQLKADIDKGLMDRLAQYGITLHDVSIVHLSFSTDFEKAIEAKQVAEQDAKKEEYVAQKATQAAKAEIERAKGQSEAQRLMKISMTSETLRQRAIDKWDGHLPNYMMGSSVPFLNLNEK